MDRPECNLEGQAPPDPVQSGFGLDIKTEVMADPPPAQPVPGLEPALITPDVKTEMMETDELAADEPTSSTQEPKPDEVDDDDNTLVSDSDTGGEACEDLESASFSVTKLLEQVEAYKPVIPESITNYLLHMTGFESGDPRVSKLISIASQKFISDILNDAFTHCKLRTAAPIGGKTKSKDKKYVLTMEDLVPVLSDYGITVKKPPYFV